MCETEESPQALDLARHLVVSPWLLRDSPRKEQVHSGFPVLLLFRQGVCVDWCPGQKSLAELCGPAGLIISSSHLPGRLLGSLPGKQTWKQEKENVAGERMSNYKWQAPAPNMQLLFKQAIYSPTAGACGEQEVCNL